MADVFDFYVYDDRSIQFELAEPIMLEDKDVTQFRFRIPKTLNGFDMSTWAWWFIYVNAKKEKYSIPLVLTNDEDEPDEYSVATFSLSYGMTGQVGKISFAIEVIDTDTETGEILHEWHTKTYTTSVTDTLQGNQVEYEEEAYDIISALVQQVMEQVAGQNTKIRMLNSRVDEIIALPEGSTALDAEVVDIRVGSDGTRYASAGEAVRGQVSELKEDLSSLSSNLYPYGIPPYMMSLFKHSDNIFSDFCNAITDSYYGVRGVLTTLGNELMIKPTTNYKGWLIRVKPNTTYTLGPCDYALIFFNSEFKSDKVIPTADLSNTDPNTVTSGSNSYWMSLTQKTARDMSEWMMVEGDTYPSEYVSGFPQWIDVPKYPDDELNNIGIFYSSSKITIEYEYRDGWTKITIPSGSVMTKSGVISTPASELEFGTSAWISYDLTANEWITVGNKAGHEQYVIGWVRPSTKTYFLNAATNVITAKKTVAFMGDSITAGVATAKCYHQYIHDKYGLTCLNYGYGGAGYYRSYPGYSAGLMGTGAEGMGVKITQENYFTPNNVVTRLAELDADVVDGIVIFAGTNDWGNNVSVEDFRTGITEAFEYCLTNYPAIPVLVMLPIHRMNDTTPNGAGKTLREYADIIVEECKHYGIAYVDTMTMSGLYPDIEANRALYFKNNLGSGLHPSEEGHRRMASVIADMLNAVISYTDLS